MDSSWRAVSATLYSSCDNCAMSWKGSNQTLTRGRNPFKNLKDCKVSGRRSLARVSPFTRPHVISLPFEIFGTDRFVQDGPHSQQIQVQNFPPHQLAPPHPRCIQHPAGARRQLVCNCCHFTAIRQDRRMHPRIDGPVRCPPC